MCEKGQINCKSQKLEMQAVVKWVALSTLIKNLHVKMLPCFGNMLSGLFLNSIHALSPFSVKDLITILTI